MRCARSDMNIWSAWMSQSQMPSFEPATARANRSSLRREASSASLRSVMSVTAPLRRAGLPLLVHEHLPARAHPRTSLRSAGRSGSQLVAFHCPRGGQLNGAKHALAVVRMERRPGEEVGPVSEPHVRRKPEHLLHARRQKDLAGLRGSRSQ